MPAGDNARRQPAPGPSGGGFLRREQRLDAVAKVEELRLPPQRGRPFRRKRDADLLAAASGGRRFAAEVWPGVIATAALAWAGWALS